MARMDEVFSLGYKGTQSDEVSGFVKTLHRISGGILPVPIFLHTSTRTKEKKLYLATTPAAPFMAMKS